VRAEGPRCAWPGADAALIAYHDEEWGVPARDDRRLFELFALAGFQAGLSWRAVLHKRAGFRRAFADFDPAAVARFGAADVARLGADAAIIRNRQKIAAAVANARAVCALREETGASFGDWLWASVGGRPIRNAWRTPAEVPATTPLAEEVSRALGRRGFRFAGPTITYAFLQSVGLVNDHLVSCFRWREIGGGEPCVTGTETAPAAAVVAVVAAWRRARALLFDFDGVLAQSEPLHREAFNAALAPWGVSIPPEEYWERWTSKGEGLDGQRRRHAPAWDAVPDDVKEEKARRFRDWCLAGRVPLHPRTPALLARLAEPGRGWSRPFTIASNTPRDLVEAVLRKGGAPAVPVVGGEALPIKPAPDIFLAGARSVGAAPADCLVFEDTEKGLRAAAAAGAPAVLVRTPENRGLALPPEAPRVAELDGLERLFEVMDRLA